MNHPTAIITGDFHLREDTPVCRTDDYWEAQWKKIKFISDLSVRYGNIPILDAGDFFNIWKPSPRLLANAIKFLPNNSIIFTVPGNHDLPQHNLGLLEKSGLSVLLEAKKIIISEFFESSELVLYSFPWGQQIKDVRNKIGEKSKIALCHYFVYQGSPPWPGAEKEGGEAERILNKLKSFDLVITGHNHESFVIRKDNRLLVNPGSMMRMSVNQIDFRPRVYLWYGKTNEVKEVFLPIEKDVISTEHLKKTASCNNDVVAWINNLKKNNIKEISFRKNLEAFFSINKTHEQTQEIVWQCIE